MVSLKLFHDNPDSSATYTEFEKQHVLERVKALDAKARRKGLAELDPGRNPLIGLGMEVNAAGKVTKNSYGVFHLSWMAAQHAEWPAEAARQVSEIRRGIREAHRAPLQFVIWAGMGGSAEDKSAYHACGLLRKGPRLYVLDSTDPAKLKAILEDMQRRSKLGLREALKRTLVAGMAMGMTSYEPVVNLAKISALYEKHGVDGKANFIYMTLPGSLLDQFAGPRGYRKVEVQLDGGNSTAGRHSSPLTCGSLYPLALAGVDLREWMAGTFLTEEEIRDAFRLASFLHTQGTAGRDKVTLMLPNAWRGVEIWTKQDFEESLGKSEALGLKVVVGERVKLANYRSPKDASQQRVFLAVMRKGDAGGVAEKAALLRRAGYPVAVVTFPQHTVLSRYMQFIHHVVFGIACLRKMNFVTQPSVELYKAITSRLVAEEKQAGGLEKTSLWREVRGGTRMAKFPGGITLYYNQVRVEPAPGAKTAPAIYASICRQLMAENSVSYAELTFFGDLRYSANGRAVRKVMDQAAERLFRGCWKLPVDVYEGPAMNHSYHEMVIGHGGAFSTVMIAEKGERIPEVDYAPGYHRAQFLATQAALAERGRAVVALVMKDWGEETRNALDSFFREALRFAAK
ncbi:MAG: Glucose-6-phosphate isomerase [Bryobacteraceae bacterium]|nr:Glucose-6-phosphate isomerase [Bryobacteraceae bacterium]